MSGFTEKQQKMYEEFNEYYSTYPTDVTKIWDKLDTLDQTQHYKTPFGPKGMMYEVLAKEAKLKVFRHCPFYFEIDSGIARGRLGGKLPVIESGFGSWIIERNRKYNDPFVEWYQPYEDKRFIHMLSKFFDTNHIIPGYENVFAYGFAGLKEKAKTYLAKETDPEKIEFYQAMIKGLDAAILLGEKFSQEAARMLETETDPEVIKNLERIRDNAKECPKNPPKTFYQAINCYWFVHEVFKIFDCMSIATIGHIDRELIGYYERDIKEGILTREEAKELVQYYLIITDGICDYYEKGRDHINANMALTIGGQNSDGSLVYNEITTIVLESMSELKLVNPNLSVRVSDRDCEKYINEIAKMIASGCNNYSVIYDEVAVQSLVNAGIDIEDARIYGTGGCQETVVPNKAHFMRAFLYVNLPMLFNMSLFGREEDKAFVKKYFDLEFLNEAQSYEEVHDIFMKNFRKFCEATAAKFREFVPDAPKYNPLPLYSSSMDGCIEKGKDYTQGGTKYYHDSIGLVGVGTIVDMLYTIKTEVFEKGTFTLKELAQMSMDNFEGEGEERKRQYLLNRVKKYGDDDEEINAFAGEIFKEMAELSSGMDDGLGGKYVASLFSYNWYVKMGFETEATLDGRKYGEAFSRSVGPTELGRTIEISKAIHSMHRIDHTDYPGITILYLDMPYSKNKFNIGLYEDILRYFMKNKGYVLQLNVVDRDKLIDARKHPEKHRNLVVRVCGFSEYFVSLEPRRQDEMIKRNEASNW